MLNIKLYKLLPVHFFLHVGGVAAAIVGEEQASIAQTVHIHLHAGAVHDHHVGVGRLPGHLQTQENGWYHMRSTALAVPQVPQQTASHALPEQELEEGNRATLSSW